MEARALETLKTILKYRGIEDIKYESVTAPLADTHMYVYGGVLVVFSEKARVSDKDLQSTIEYSEKNGHNNGIVIVSDSRPSAAVLSRLRRYVASPEHPLVQIFELRHLQFDISQHRRVPKHRIIQADELEAVLKEFHASGPQQFPKIDSQDAMAKWIGARPGNVIEVLGLCESSGNNRRYRLCVEDVANA
jgi:DNA-directed RNA polymerase subunit H (RpoH/RPB5)